MEEQEEVQLRILINCLLVRYGMNQENKDVEVEVEGDVYCI